MTHQAHVRFLGGLFGLMSFFAVTSHAHAATIYADGDAMNGGTGTPEYPVNTLTAALTLIVPGEENIIYATGTFAEKVEITATTGGQSEDTRTIIDQWPGRLMPVNDVTLGDVNGKPVYLAYYLNGTSYVTIRNQRTMGAKATNIWSQYSHNIVLENNITSNANEKGICVYSSQDVVVRGNTSFDNGLIGIYMPISSERILVEDNLAYGNAEHGILAGNGSRDITVRNNTAYDNNWKGIVGGGNLAARGTGGETQLVFENNTVWGGDVGIAINGWSNVTLERNDIRDTLNEGVSIRGNAGVTVFGNTVVGSQGGISVAQTQNAVVDSNIVRDTSRSGIFVSNGSSTILQNNLLVRNNAGMNVTDPVSVRVINNTIVGNTTGIFVLSPSVPQPTLTLGNNIFADNATIGRISVQNGNGILSDFNAFSGYQTFIFFNGQQLPLSKACAKGLRDCHSTDSLDPMFVNPLVDDYHLQATSPLIGRGRLNGAPALDMDGDDRTIDGKVDIGADEVMI